MIGAVLFIVFVIVELTQKEPLIELSCFQSIEFSKGMLLTCLNWLTIFGSMLLIPIFLQQVRGLTSFEAGLQTIPQAIMSFIGMVVGGKLFDRYGARPVVFSGMVIYSVGMFLMSGMHVDTNSYLMIGCFMILGLGQGLTTMQIGTHVLKSAPEHLISRVTSLTNSGQQVFGSFAIAIMSGVLSSRIAYHMHHVNVQHAHAALQATAFGFDNTFFFAFCLTLVSLLLSLTLRTKKKASVELVESE